jgi:hypothetical protein
MPVEANELRPTLNLVRHFLKHDQGVHFTSSHLSSLGLDLVSLQSVVQRDQLVRNLPFHWGQYVIRVVKHDEGINARACTYLRVCWIMFLAFPLDF